MNLPEGYPEQLGTVACTVAGELVTRGLEADLAEQLGFAAAEAVRRHHGGENLYFPKGRSFELTERDLKIFEELRPGNYADVARKYSVTVRRVYQIYNAVRIREFERRQSKLAL